MHFPYLERSSWVVANAIDSALGESTVQKSTGRNTKSTGHDTKSTDHDILTTLGDTSAHVAKVDLRRIASDFLTSRIRVGSHTVGENREKFLTFDFGEQYYLRSGL